MRHLRLLRAFTGATTELNLSGRYQPRVGQGSLPLRQRAGQKKRVLLRFPRSEQCQPRPGERSQRRNVQGGPRLGRIGKQLETRGRTQTVTKGPKGWQSGNVQAV